MTTPVKPGRNPHPLRAVNWAGIESPSWSYTHRGYALLHSFRQLSRSRFATLLTLAVLGIAMTLPVVFLFLSDDIQQIPIDIGRGQSLTLYLDPTVSDLDGAAIAAEIEKRAAVASIDYVSRDEALATFQAHTEFEGALELLNENPLPAAIVVYPDTANQNSAAIELLAKQLTALPNVERVQFDLQWVERLEAVVSLGRISVLVLAVLLTLTALMVIGNTIRLEMLRRARETEVARLLGATQRFVSRQFIYLGALYGLLGGIIAVLSAIGIQHIMNQPIKRLAAAYGSQFSLSPPSLSHLGLVLTITIVLGITGALWAQYWQNPRQTPV